MVGARWSERCSSLPPIFRPLAVYRGRSTLAEYLEGETDGVPNQQVLLEEMLMLWLANKNPAFGPSEELFDDTRLPPKAPTRPCMAELHPFFDTQPRFGPEQQNLIDMLRAPAVAVPHSLAGQLEYHPHPLGRTAWDATSAACSALLTSLDLIRRRRSSAGMAARARCPSRSTTPSPALKSRPRASAPTATGCPAWC